MPNCTADLNFFILSSLNINANPSSNTSPNTINNRFSKIVFHVALVADPDENRYSKFFVSGEIQGLPNIPSAKLKSLNAVTIPNMGR